MRVRMNARSHSTTDLQRSHEGIEAMDGYQIQIKASSEADIRQIVADLRTGWAESPSTSDRYPWVNSPTEDMTQGDGVWLSTLDIAAKRVGKARDSD
jgi:hypothetical protein